MHVLLARPCFRRELMEAPSGPFSKKLGDLLLQL